MALTRFHLLLQRFIHRGRQGGLKGPLQCPRLAGALQALWIGTEVGAPSGLLSLKIQGNLSLRAFDHSDQLPLFLHLPAADTLPHGDLFGHASSPLSFS